MAIVIPNIFQDGVGQIASGAQVNENFEVVVAAIEAEEARNAVASNKYTARTVYTINEPHVLSADHWAHAILSFNSPAQPPTIEAKVLVGGVDVGQTALVGETANRFFIASVQLAPAETVELLATGAWALSISYRLLGT